MKFKRVEIRKPEPRDLKSVKDAASKANSVAALRAVVAELIVEVERLKENRV